MQVISRVGGAQIGRVVAGKTGGGTVQTPQIFSERVRAFMAHFSKDRAQQLINDAVTSDSPDLLKTLLLPLDKPQTRKETLLQLNKTLNLWLASDGKRIFENGNETTPIQTR